MALRRVDITRSVNISDLETLRNNPHVRNPWVMPWKFTLFEFYDPIYEQLGNPASGISDVTEWTEETRRYMERLVDTERDIMSPIYRGRPRHWQGNRLALFLKSAIYRIVDKQTLALPWLGQSADWEVATRIRIAGRLRKAAYSDVLENVVAQWAEWLQTAGQEPKRENLEFKGNDFHFVCEFRGTCGDSCLALYTALIATYQKTSIEAVGFFLPEQTELRYLEIGGRGEILTAV